MIEGQGELNRRSLFFICEPTVLNILLEVTQNLVE